MNEMLNSGQVLSRLKLAKWAAAGQLFALMDSFFSLPGEAVSERLEIKDTDPLFYDVIAWDKVTYEPPSLACIDESALSWLLNTLSTERWGVFLVSPCDFRQLRVHIQKFVIAKGPDQNPYFLRFHDAAVLEVLLATWQPQERATFVAPIGAIGLPSLDTMEVQIWENPSKVQSLHVVPRPEECLLSLRAEQLRACSDAIDRDLVKIIYWHLRNHHARAVQHLPRPLLEARVRFAINKARGYELSSISDLAGFVALMFELAPNFDEHPAFQKVLVDSALPADSKMKKLSRVITDRDWDEAQQIFDRKIWAMAKKTR